MKQLIAALVILTSTELLSASSYYFLQLGNCLLPLDINKEREKIDRSLFICQKSRINLDGIFISEKTLGLAGRIELIGSAHYGTTHALIYDYYFERIGSTKSDELSFAKNSTLDTAVYQFGNPSSDKFRILLGQQKIPFGVNHYPDIGYNQLFDPRYIWSTPQLGAALIYDSQKKTQFEVGWTPNDNRNLKNKLRNNYAFTARITYDFSLTSSTRALFSVMAFKNGEKRMNIGLIGHGPKKNSVQAEWVRIYSAFSSTIEDLTKGGLSEIPLKSSYTQLIRLSYEDPPDRNFRFSFLYDDLSFHYRLFSLSLSFNYPKKWSVVKLLASFKQDLTIKKRHRWILGSGIGFQL